MASVLQPNVAHSFNYASDGLQSNLRDVRSGQYYVTHELNREMSGINNGVNHMKLDSDFLTSSKQWGHRFNTEDLNKEKAEAASKIANGSSFVGQYKGNFGIPKVQTLQENQVREMHQWAGDNLGSIKRPINPELNDLHPYAKSAQGRIDQFCDYIGVTDRYTGYRHNLTRGSRDPTKLGMAWLDPSQRNSYSTPQQYNGEKPPGKVFLPASLPRRRLDEYNTHLSIDNMNPLQATKMRSHTAPPTKSIQERCGINTTFPGITEYMKRYNQKRAPEKLTHFNINPTPDFSYYGRPTAAVTYTPNHTEYQTRFEWPECRKIVKKPWLRK
ncbi:hypothetical protein EB796_003764 [Bugula neritina]|uniref:Uncharacterized protein n=1 Tax=Bugula neritina TaxID=10212 RepID=A0A7J7KI26_BUGNE|nr:hypothetical protein EB796_003764 [Bugula neritina]